MATFSRSAIGSLIILGTVLLAACDQAGSGTELPRPTTVPAKLVWFNGTLQPNTTDAHTFLVSQDGYVEVTLVGLGAPPTTSVSLGIGTPGRTGGCSLNQSVTTVAGPTAQIVGTGLAGTLCVTITDDGKLTGPTIYTITVASS